MEARHYPIPRIECGAKTRTGGSCRQPAMKNGRCRLHGGKSKSGKEHGRYKHGLRSRETIEKRREVRAMLKEAKSFLADLGGL